MKTKLIWTRDQSNWPPGQEIHIEDPKGRQILWMKILNLEGDPVPFTEIETGDVSKRRLVGEADTHWIEWIVVCVSEDEVNITKSQVDG